MDTDKIYAEHIVNKYSVKRKSNVVALRKLDARAGRPANIFAFSFGIFSAIVFGTGLCMTMGKLGSGTTAEFIAGILFGALGLLFMGVNYPIYRRIFLFGKRKYAPDIVNLARQIIDNRWGERPQGASKGARARRGHTHEE